MVLVRRTNGVSFSLVDGAIVCIHFPNGMLPNDAKMSYTINVNSTGAKSLKYASVTNGTFSSYDGYSTGTSEKYTHVPGIMPTVLIYTNGCYTSLSSTQIL